MSQLCRHVLTMQLLGFPTAALGLGTEAEGPIAEVGNKKFESSGSSFFVKSVTPKGKLLRK